MDAKKDNLIKLIFGLIMTIIIILIVDNLSVKLNLILRIAIVLILVFLGLSVFNKIFVKEKE